MNDTSSKPPRPTLKLKVSARRPTGKTRSIAAPEPLPDNKPEKQPRTKPGADWADEYKRRMQEDMDALLR
jgi:hypothetical protein